MQVISVSEFNNLLNQIFADLPELVVEGEITSLKYSKGNAVFMDLKDPNQQSLLKVSNYAPSVQGLAQVEEGMRVWVHGRPEIYSPYGSFSFKPYKIEPVGEGSLKIAYEKLKLLLEKEGLFAEERKRKLVGPISRIALLTGKDSAAYSDFCKILEEYNSSIVVDFYPILVQGDNSESEIVSTLKKVSGDGYDAIILTRGGGSLEDLKSFNSESVARAIFSSKIPVISAIGHEVDNSITDFVADIRASTPSQAAYYLVSLNQSIIDDISNDLDQILNLVLAKLPKIDSIQNYNRILNQGIRNIIPEPGEVNKKIGILNYAANSMSRALSTLSTETEYKRNNMNKLEAKRLEMINRLSSVNLLLKSYDPMSVLNRGYALVENAGKYVSDIRELNEGEEVGVKLKKGKFKAKITELK